ncbi:hypothetical protein [Paenibacillus taiwanensis]|uniref:hypothetical protein n=1 Tax=Paenibacillus taiwanensis TaxID=401638 RepID=UPI00042203A3|nr:hypothetical protein [Paenibacillus taiwanensis]
MSGYNYYGYNGGNNGIAGLLHRISIGTRIRVHFDSTSHEGIFLGIQSGSVLISRNNGNAVYIPLNKVLAIDLI